MNIKINMNPIGKCILKLWLFDYYYDYLCELGYSYIYILINQKSVDKKIFYLFSFLINNFYYYYRQKK